MATKTAVVTARIQPEIKAQAEAILEQLGVPASVFIDMCYRQVVMHGGIPFSIQIPYQLSDEDRQFKEMIHNGILQAQQGKSMKAEQAFEELRMVK